MPGPNCPKDRPRCRFCGNTDTICPVPGRPGAMYARCPATTSAFASALRTTRGHGESCPCDSCRLLRLA